MMKITLLCYVGQLTQVSSLNVACTGVEIDKGGGAQVAKPFPPPPPPR